MNATPTPLKLLAAALLASLGACSMTPPLETPKIEMAATFKESGPWTTAQPQDRLPRDRWWTVYGDTELDALQARLIEGNPSLAAAVANYEQSRAISDQLRSGLFPSLGIGAGYTRQRSSADLANPAPIKETNLASLSASVSYELDVWGRVRNATAAGDAGAAAAALDLENVRLLLCAQLLDSYAQLRGLDRATALLEQSVAAYEQALSLTRQRHGAGIASGLDVAQAQTLLENTRSKLDQTRGQRAVLEHAIAALVGAPAPSFSIAPSLAELRLPQLPAGLPSELLQRRPDVAAAERRVEAANANIGAVRAAFYPSITLGLQGGYQSQHVGNLISSPSSVWALGPSLLLSAFDGGLRKAQQAQARAEFDNAAASYRRTALGAFAEVEDSLALLHHFGDAELAKRAALEAAGRALNLSMNLYKKGASDYLAVVTAQTNELQARLDAVDLRTQQLRASVALNRALGGGWRPAGDPPQQ